MKRKSVYLFSVAILGCSLMPNNVWADENTETAAPSVTTELVESTTTAAPILETPKEEAIPAEPVVAHEEPEVVHQEAEVIQETSEAVGEESEAVAAPDEPVKPIEPETITQPKVEEQPEVEVQPQTARATSSALKDQNDGKIVDHGKTITDDDAKIPAEYNFMPNFDHLEDIEVNAPKGYKESSTAYYFELKNAAPGSITIVYKNVGTYNGKVVDMKVTVKDWTVLSGSFYRNPALYIHKKNGITMNGIKDVRLNYAFLDNLTASAINISGFFNFTDIDLLQSIDLFNNNNIQNYYVTKGNELYYKVHNGYIKIGEVNQKNTSPENMNHWLTYTYQGVSNFDVRYNQDYETGAVFTYTYQAPVVIEEKPAEPEAIPVKPAQESPKEEIKAEESSEVKTDVKSEVKAEPKELNITAKPEKKAVIETKVAKAKPLKQAVLPQTNMQSSSLLTILGGACVFLLSAIFLNKKKI
jgi:LPXTG-motif cell wall-anchored protein